MRVQVGHDKNDFLCIRIHHIYKVLNFFDPINCCSVFSDAGMMSATQRFNKDNNTACTISDVIEFLSKPASRFRPILVALCHLHAVAEC